MTDHPLGLNGADMVTTRDMRIFALDCLKWADGIANPSNQQIIVGFARMWLQAAHAIDRRLADSSQLGPDLRMVLD
jgi:hypothetical protein